MSGESEMAARRSPSGTKADADSLRALIAGKVAEYHAAAFPRADFVPGETPIPAAGKVFDAAELQCAVDAALDFWLTSGRFAERFEREFAQFCGVKHASLVNSGSSANLLALACLTSPTLGERALRPGDEVITVAAGFPTTLNPILQYGLTPVFVDVTAPTWNADVTQLRDALGPRTKAVVLAHALGNPFDVSAVTSFADEHSLWLIEDCCDAVGATWRGERVGGFGDLATASFYPAHHITMGEGGCVMTNSDKLRRLVESFRDWGRDCRCAPGRDDTCGRRFSRQLGGLPFGYDHKYTYSHIGYNLKATDLQAAAGVAQLAKLPRFIEARRRNFTMLREGLDDLQECFVLPEATPGSEPSWFGFPIGVRDDAPLSREEIVRELESRRIGTRPLFGGNLLEQPAYRNINRRVVGELRTTDFVMRRVFWIGVYPGLSEPMLRYVIDSLHEIARKPPCAASSRAPQVISDRI
jgi:CDP-6-deoxy-D-xylo-4-hexulose-3-dehydrase